MQTNVNDPINSQPYTNLKKFYTKSIKLKITILLLLISLIPTVSFTTIWYEHLTNQILSIVTEYISDGALNSQAAIQQHNLSTQNLNNLEEQTETREIIKQAINTTLTSFRHISFIFLYSFIERTQTLEIIDTFIQQHIQNNNQDNINECTGCKQVLQEILDNPKIKENNPIFSQGLYTINILPEPIKVSSKEWLIATIPLFPNKTSKYGIGIVVCTDFLNTFIYKSIFIAIFLSLGVLLLTLLISILSSHIFIKPYISLFLYLENLKSQLFTPILMPLKNIDKNCAPLLTLLTIEINRKLKIEIDKNKIVKNTDGEN